MKTNKISVQSSRAVKLLLVPICMDLLWQFLSILAGGRWFQCGITPDLDASLDSDSRLVLPCSITFDGKGGKGVFIVKKSKSSSEAALPLFFKTFSPCGQSAGATSEVVSLSSPLCCKTRDG
jgi:hypothetical protein